MLIQRFSLNIKNKLDDDDRSSKHNTLTQYRFNLEPPSTLATTLTPTPFGQRLLITGVLQRGRHTMDSSSLTQTILSRHIVGSWHGEMIPVIGLCKVLYCSRLLGLLLVLSSTFSPHVRHHVSQFVKDLFRLLVSCATWQGSSVLVSSDYPRESCSLNLSGVPWLLLSTAVLMQHRAGTDVAVVVELPSTIVTLGTSGLLTRG